MKSFYTNPGNSKEVLASECRRYVCPFVKGRSSMCWGPECMAWKWTGFNQEQVTIHVQNDPRSEFEFSAQEQKKRTFTHGCCGIVYQGEIEIGEIKSNGLV